MQCARVKFGAAWFFAKLRCDYQKNIVLLRCDEVSSVAFRLTSPSGFFYFCSLVWLKSNTECCRFRVKTYMTITQL